MPDPVFGLAYPEDAALENQLFAELVAGARKSYQIQKREQGKEDRERWVRVSVSLFPREDGRDWQFAPRQTEDIGVTQ